MKSRDRIEMSKGVVRYFLDHREVTQAAYEAEYPPPAPGKGVPGGATSWRKPVTSISMGVHPDQVEEAREEDRRRGLGETEYAKDGSLVFRDRSSRRAYLKAYGKIDKDSFTGY